MNRMAQDGTPCSYDDAYSVCFQGECEVFIYMFNSFSLGQSRFWIPSQNNELHAIQTVTGSNQRGGTPGPRGGGEILLEISSRSIDRYSIRM